MPKISKQIKDFFVMIFWLLMLAIGILACLSVIVVIFDAWGKVSVIQTSDPGLSGLIANLLTEYFGKNIIFFYIFPICSLPILFWASHLARKES